FSKPLKHLSADDLREFTGRAITTWGEVNDYKHFLPRILELTASYDGSHDFSRIFDKLEYGKWETWDKDEKDVIQEYMLVFWKEILKDSTKNTEDFFVEYFYVCARFYSNFSELLSIWEINTSKAATKHLADFIFYESPFIFSHKNNNHELKNWLLSDKIIHRLEAAFYQYAQEPLGERISWAEKILTDEKKSANKNQY
ncbi:MAG: hypothetical protein ACJ751_01070, partial [Niastella sp.]|uniref:hypothetical protein n=1 Tax=Niastella sp. TaxID=1869183 RepID=UPI00389A2122